MSGVAGRPCFRAVLAYLPAAEMLTGCAPACRELHRLVHREMSPVIRTAAHLIGAHTLVDGSRVHLTGGTCAQLLVRGRCRLTGSGTIRTLRVMHRDDAVWAAGLTVERLLVSRGAAVLKHCRLEGASNHCVLASRCKLRLDHCDVQHTKPGTHYVGVHARRTALRMRDCRVRRCFAGLQLEDCQDTLVERTAVRECREGVILERCRRAGDQGGVRLERCSLREMSMGLQLQDCSHQVVVSGAAVEVHQSGTALQVQGGSGAPCVEKSVLAGNVTLLDGTQCVFHHNTVTGSVRVCRAHPTVVDNRIAGTLAVRRSGGVVAHNRVSRGEGGGSCLIDDGSGRCAVYSNTREEPEASAVTHPGRVPLR